MISFESCGIFGGIYYLQEIHRLHGVCDNTVSAQHKNNVTLFLIEGHHGPGLLLMIAVAVSLVNVFLTILLIFFWYVYPNIIIFLLFFQSIGDFYTTNHNPFFLLSFQRCSRKKVKLNQEDRTYMSLQKRDISPVYDVISQFQNQQVSSSM